MHYYYSKLKTTQRRKVRLEMAKNQNQQCWYCKNPLSGPAIDKVENYDFNMNLFPPGMFNYPVHLHHDHKTDICLGAVHCKCNAYMWQQYGE